MVPGVANDGVLHSACLVVRFTANSDALASRHLRPELVIDRLHGVPSLALVALQGLHVVGQRRLCCAAGAPVALGQEEQRLLSGSPLGRKDLVVIEHRSPKLF